jgi:hypothetical protein
MCLQKIYLNKVKLPNEQNYRPNKFGGQAPNPLTALNQKQPDSKLKSREIPKQLWLILLSL